MKNPVLLFVINVDWFFRSHRIELAKAALDSGYEVHLCCAITDPFEDLEKIGIHVHPVDIARSSTSFLKECAALKGILSIVRRVRPDVLHLVTIKPVIYGGIAGRLFNIETKVSAISGLGFVFSSSSLKARLLKPFIRLLYRFAIKGKRSHVIFQNSSDRDAFVESRICSIRDCVMIPGSGICLNRYQPSIIPVDEAPRVLFLARLLKEKGIYDFVEAAKILKKKHGSSIRMTIAGSLDIDNPSGVTEQVMSEWLANDLIEYLGFCDRTSELISSSSIVVLPSYYGEGLPKTLIEAAACGRPVITTDHPGCKDAIIDGKTGELVPVRSPTVLASKILEFTSNREKLIRMGVEARELAESRYDIKHVVNKHLELYGSYNREGHVSEC